MKKRTSKEDLRHLEWAHAQPVTTRCTLCAWTFEGTVVEGREASREHRELHAEEFRRREEERAAEKRRERERARRCRDDERARQLAVRKARQGIMRAKPGLNGRTSISEEQLLEARRLNEQGMTLLALGREFFAEWGYKSPGSATSVLSVLFARRGWSVSRSHREPRRLESHPTLVLMTPARRGVALWLWEVGCSPGQMATYAWEVWGFANANSCKTAITKMLRREGVWLPRRDGISTEIPDVARSDAIAAISAVA